MLPNQSTVSRRTRRGDFTAFLEPAGDRPGGTPRPSLLDVVDGKPLEPPNHTAAAATPAGAGA